MPMLGYLKLKIFWKLMRIGKKEQKITLGWQFCQLHVGYTHFRWIQKSCTQKISWKKKRRRRKDTKINSKSIFKCDYLKNNNNNEMKFICINQTQAQYNLTANPHLSCLHANEKKSFQHKIYSPPLKFYV